MNKTTCEICSKEVRPSELSPLSVKVRGWAARHDTLSVKLTYLDKFGKAIRTDTACRVCILDALDAVWGK